MSTSRLEKFIYAICSMEVSDLPAPLSRIEILWNCLITGETPDFEPQSRNEQYLMAMLGLYELENLPTPISRGEKLLYKIAMGETDLSDVPGYLSRYEELLKYLIENGGISGGDFEYVLYTLNQSLSTLYATVKKPVKSAILSGQTLVNISNINKFSLSYNERLSTKNKVQVGKTYLQVIAITKNTLSPANDKGNVASINDSDGVNNFANEYHRVAINETGILKKVYTVTSTSGKNDTSVRTYSITTEGVLEGYEMLIEYQEGMENWDIPYFEGMQSVKMPVLMTSNQRFTILPYEIFENSTPISYQGFTRIDFGLTLTDVMCYIKLNNDMQIKMIIDGFEEVNTNSGISKGVEYSKKLNNISYIGFYNWSDIQFGRGKETILSMLKNGELEIIFSKDGEKKYPYYSNITKTNILSTSEDVVLRKVRDVQDTLDCLTGEVTERICENVLDDSAEISLSSLNSTLINTMAFGIATPNIKKVQTAQINDKFPSININDYDNDDYEHSYSSPSSERIWFFIDKSKLTENSINGVKQWLSQNPITVQYQLATESIKTVDLITVDQDGQPTQLKTFNDITHVELSSEGLIPEVELEVATKINETLLTMSPQHHDISETQNKLGQTIDEQTENTDAAMLATTEIYEQTL